MRENFIEKYPYLKLLKKNLNEQQLAVCCHTDNCVVAAGAGSGKTQVLATRFAWLVMEFDDISASSILTLTFTKKAAAEMYQRIYSTLLFFSQNSEVPLRQRNNAMKALNEFAGVHIQTLDSYCGGIVRQTANRYGIRPDFITGQEDPGLSQLALSFVLKNRSRKSVKHFADAGRLQNFAEDFILGTISEYTSLATESGWFEKMFSLQCEKIITTWNDWFSKNNASGKCRIEKQVYAYLNEAKIISEAEDFSKLKKKQMEFINKLLALDIDEISCETLTVDELKENRKYVLDKMNSCISIIEEAETYGGKSKEDLLQDFLKSSAELKESVSELYSLKSFVAEYEWLLDLNMLLDEFLSKVNAQKRQSGHLTFKDVNEMALRILIEQKDIRNQEKSSFKKIMIDEFQDNNGKNRDLLFLLSEKNDVFTEVPSDYSSPDLVHQSLKQKLSKDKLFFVGDEKQSIYKFRGADVAVFNELKQDLKEINGEDSSLYMIYNYRSTPELISSFNQMFGGYKASEDNYNETENKSVFMRNFPENFEALFTESAVARIMKDSSEQKPAVINENNVSVHVALLAEDSSFKSSAENYEVLDKENQLAYFVAEKIKELHENGVAYSDIAILDRRRSGRLSYTSWLERFQIPYSLDQQNGIFQDAPVNDIYNFLRLCVYPSDVNSFAAYLCSPFAGLEESDLEKILAVTNNIENNFRAFDVNNIELRNKIIFELGKNSYAEKKYEEAEKFFIEQQQQVLSQPVTETLNRLWYDCGYRFETLLNTKVNLFAEQYDFLFELSQKTDREGKSVAWFVDQLALQKAKEKSSMSSDSGEMDVSEVNFPKEKECSVQILTIHKSKGLQYKHVFLLGVFGSTKSEKSEDIYFDETFGVTFRSVSSKENYFQKKDKDLSSQKNLAEFRRLIYVGATRAEKSLYIVSDYAIKVNGEHSVDDKKIMDNLVEQYYPDFVLMDEGKSFNDGAPFDITKIKPVPYSIYHDFSGNVDCDNLRHEKIHAIKKCIADNNISLVELDVEKNKRISPSGLEKLADENDDVNKMQSEKLYSDVSCKTKTSELQTELQFDELYPEIDEVMNEVKNDVFSFSTFGTLSHLFLQNSANGLPESFAEDQAQKLVKKLKASQKDKLFSVCNKICDAFRNGPQGKLLENCRNEKRFYRAEYQFKMMLSGYLVTGSIDLVFQNNDGTYTIVDYKTDHDKCPEKYYGQQTCYRKAFAALKKIPEEKVKCLLYFIRSNSFVDITLETSGELTASMFDLISSDKKTELIED